MGSFILKGAAVVIGGFLIASAGVRYANPQTASPQSDLSTRVAHLESAVANLAFTVESLVRQPTPPAPIPAPVVTPPPDPVRPPAPEPTPPAPVPPPPPPPPAPSIDPGLKAAADAYYKVDLIIFRSYAATLDKGPSTQTYDQVMQRGLDWHNQMKLGIGASVNNTLRPLLDPATRMPRDPKAFAAALRAIADAHEASMRSQ